MKPFCQKILKPWGYELILTPPASPVTGKIAFTKKSQRWSFQYHDKKEETLCLIQGEATLWLENEKGKVEKIKMVPQEGYLIKPLQKHRFCAVKDCLSLEVSTPEVGKTVRLEDDYGNRGDETEEERRARPEGKVYLG